MCSTPKMPTPKNIVPQAPQMAQEPPKPVEIDKDSTGAAKRKRNPLRIDLASSGGGASSGVTI